MKSLLLGALFLVAAGCKSNPYCLNCKDGGNGVITPEDMTPTDDIGGTDDMGEQPDLFGQGGPCVPTNGGVEICDQLDNDCNGQVDDVPPESLVGNPNHCGACGMACKFPHAPGICVGGFDGGVPTCKPDGCQPGYIDLDGKPANGCEYVCTPTSPPTEACDGKDNNCDGTVDEGFTTTWFDLPQRMPKYDSALANCGQCGVVCSLGAGTVMQCMGTGVNGRGQCSVKQCFNDLDSMSVHQTYRHNPAAGSIDVTGCEVHCPSAATTLGNNCNPNGACTFPAESCNGIDDDCDFTADNNLTGFGGACPDGAPGKLCTNATTCPNGECRAGTYQCVAGGATCVGSVGPAPESCNAKDDDCNGKVDDPYTATWTDVGNQQPRYDSDKNNCGACTTACGLPHAPNICRRFGADAVGSCATAGCDAGWNYVTHRDSSAATPTCNVPTAGGKDSTAATTGLGCFYACPVVPIAGESCNGKDDDCEGCIDNGITAPPIACSNLGVCAGQGVTVKCTGASGYKCDYSGVPNVSLDAMGNLAATELQCDNLDNNCEGRCDENFPNVGVSGAGCTNAPRTAKTCTAGLGVCQDTKTYACANNDATKPYNNIEQCSAAANTAAAKDEECNGKDDDCNGQIDEPTDYTPAGGGTTFKGWHDKVVTLTVAADPFTGQAMHTVYAYQFEATRPDATATSPGSQSQRACSVAGRLPWANVTLAQAKAACAGITNLAGTSIGRLCSAWEWQQACNGNAGAGSHWSMSSSSTSYVAQVCNDAAQIDQRCLPGATPSQCTKTCNAGGQCTCLVDADCSPGFTCNVGLGICKGAGAWPTGSIGSFGAGNQCFVLHGTDQAHDYSGNLQEWTSTPVTLKSGAAATIVAGPQAGQWQVNGLTGILTTDAGAQLIITNATLPANNGTFDIVSVVSATSVVISNPNGAAQAAPATINWKFVYNKIRGGNYATNSSGGDTCEFDFDIQRASFFNTNVGFRCCSDSAP